MSIKNFLHPLMSNNFEKAVFNPIIKLFKKKNVILTQSKNVKKFEQMWSKWLGVKYSVFVNSGSSANLLAFFSSVNPKNKRKLYKNDECLIPALCWSTSLWPIVQTGLKIGAKTGCKKRLPRLAP